VEFVEGDLGVGQAFGSADDEGRAHVDAYLGDGLGSSAMGRVSRTRRLHRTVRNCTRDEGGPFEAGSQVQVSSHRKLLSSRAMVVLCQEGARAPCCTRDEGGPFGAVL